jgi:hypothetical protein
MTFSKMTTFIEANPLTPSATEGDIMTSAVIKATWVCNNTSS